MSFQQKKKIIDKLILDDKMELELEDDQQIVVYLGTAGVNIHRVIPLEFCPDLQIDAIPETCTEAFLVSMPKKFRGLQYLRKCDLILTDKIVEGKKVLGEINCIVSKDHVLSLYRQKLWPPSEFFDRLETQSPDATTAWTSRFNNAFVAPVTRKNDRACEVQEDFISSDDASEHSEDSEEENEDEARDCDYQDSKTDNDLISPLHQPSEALTNK